MESAYVEMARIRLAQHSGPGGEPLIAPGSPEEAEALARIDELRYEEREKLEDTFAARRKRAARSWGKRHRRH